MEAQEVFDTVVAHLAQQKRKSVAHYYHYYAAEDETHMCAYRGAGGTKCAVGCLIPDEHYDPCLEGSTIIGWRIQKVLERVGIARHVEILADLQHTHDNFHVERWPAMLRKVAAYFGLRSSMVDELMGPDWVAKVQEAQ